MRTSFRTSAYSMASRSSMALAAVLALTFTGCGHLPGKPGLRQETLRPDQTHNFAVLYKTNCSACHGDDGMNGAALPLNNPVYLAWAGRAAMINVVTNGVPHQLMPAFGPGGGGLLTDVQVGNIVDGMISHWGRPDVLNGAHPPSYTANGQGDVALGKVAFQTYCARCHGADGKGTSGGGDSSKGALVKGSIVNPTYLALISSQGLRDIVVAGMPGEDMPDWRSDVQGSAMSDKEVTDVVAWIVSQRVKFPGTFIAPAQQQAMQPQK